MKGKSQVKKRQEKDFNFQNVKNLLFIYTQKDAKTGHPFLCKNDYYIKDLNSTNGTLVNDELVPKDKYVKLKMNDKIKIGRTELTFK